MWSPLCKRKTSASKVTIKSFPRLLSTVLLCSSELEEMRWLWTWATSPQAPSALHPPWGRTGETLGIQKTNPYFRGGNQGPEKCSPLHITHLIPLHWPLSNRRLPFGLWWWGGGGRSDSLSLLLCPDSGSCEEPGFWWIPHPCFQMLVSLAHSLLATFLVTESSAALTLNDWSQNFSRLFRFKPFPLHHPQPAPKGFIKPGRLASLQLQASLHPTGICSGSLLGEGVPERISLPMTSSLRQGTFYAKQAQDGQFGRSSVTSVHGNSRQLSLQRK